MWFSINNKFQTPFEKPKKKGRSKKKKIGIGFGVMILLFFGFSILASIGSESNEAQLKNPELSPAQIKDVAIHGISYDDLMRNNENHVGEIIYLKGQILQVQKIYGDTYALRIATDKEEFFGYIDDIVYVNYAGPRVLEEDVVEVWGTVKGLKEYTAVLGNVVTIPEVDSLLLEVT